MKLFTGKDFLNYNAKVMPGEKDSLDCMADIANAKLEKWLAEAPVVYQRVPGAPWMDVPLGFNPPEKTAKLVCIESSS